MKKYLYLILTLCVVSLTGCGKEEVNYAEEDTTTEIETTSAESVTSGTIQEMLGIDDGYNWKETIGTDSGSVKVAAEVRIDISGEVSALEVEEYYYSAEDKKKVLEYFLEPESIRVDRDTYPTKELLQRKLEQYETALKEEQSLEEPIVSEEEITLITHELQRLTDRINEAPAYDEVAEAVTDYSENYYGGTRDGLEYSLTFDINEEENRSGWTLQAKDYSEFLKNKDNIVAWQGEYYTEVEDSCTMTQAEAIEYVEKLCNELGFNGMKRGTEPEYIVWYFENGEQECNGYYIEYTLDMNLWPTIFSEGITRGGYIDTTKTDRPFDEAAVSIMINDTGIIRMECKGIVKMGEPSPVKMLSYDQIKECYRSILANENEAHSRWIQLILCYVRLSSADNPDVYTYVPAWKLSNYFALPSIMLNAIDGTQIDMQNDIYVLYNTPQDWLTSSQINALVRKGILDERYVNGTMGIVEEMQ